MSTRPIYNILFDDRNGVFFPIEAPENMIFNQGITEAIYRQRNGRGELKFRETLTDESLGAVQMIQPRYTKIIMSLLYGHNLNTTSLSAADYIRGKNIGRGNNRQIPAAATGFYGEGIVADDDSFEAYALVAGRERQLARQASASFDPATQDDSFSVGADGLFTFSDNLPQNAIAAIRGQVAVASADYLDKPYTSFQLKSVNMLQYENVAEAFVVHLPRLQLNRQENSTIDLSQAPVTINFRDIDDGCVPDVKFFNVEAFC